MKHCIIKLHTNFQPNQMLRSGKTLAELCRTKQIVTDTDEQKLYYPYISILGVTTLPYLNDFLLNLQFQLSILYFHELTTIMYI